MSNSLPQMNLKAKNRSQIDLMIKKERFSTLDVLCILGKKRK